MANMNRRKLFGVATIVVAGLLFTGTRSAQAADAEQVARNAANYIPNLVMDLLDVFKLNISAGKGTGANLRFTRMLEAGYANYDVKRYGLNGRDEPVYAEAITEKGVGIIGITIGELERDPYELGLTLHTEGGFEIAANLRSALDFLTGIFLIDLEGDDTDFF
jgi:hypothetical protein